MGTCRFERGKEALLQGIILTITHAAHADADVMVSQQRPVSEAGVLTATIRVMQSARLGLPLAQRPVQGAFHQIGFHLFGHCPAHKLAPEPVCYPRQVTEAFPRFDVTDVAAPFLVRLGGVEFPIEQISGAGSARLREQITPCPFKAA